MGHDVGAGSWLRVTTLVMFTYHESRKCQWPQRSADTDRETSNHNSLESQGASFWSGTCESRLVGLTTSTMS